MSITSDDPSDIEEERRLCYVGITRAMRHLTLTSARMRMIRGENRFNKPVPLPEGDFPPIYGERRHPVPEGQGTSQVLRLQPGKDAFRAKAFEAKQFTVTKAAALDYGVGDTVRHLKFGVGIVTAINEGGRDYEVTVDFEKAGTKKMFASFAKLVKL